jgi:hypothetical protein
VLNPRLTVDAMVGRALEKSKDSFRDFCEFMENNKELGKANCIITLTEGRFRTKIRNQVIPWNLVVKNQCDKSLVSLRQFLLRWEDLYETKAGLENKLVQDVNALVRELEQNNRTLMNRFDDYEFSIKGPSGRLRLDDFQRLKNIREGNDRKIRWFILKTEKGLEEDLNRLYERIKEYNSLDRLIAREQLRTLKDIERLNAEREQLQKTVAETKERLVVLQRKFIKK